MPLRVAAIDFLNPAPLMWDFYHPPLASALATRYTLTATSPAQCAQALLEDRADLGLIPIAALTPDLRIVPGSAIASLREVRSIQLIVKPPFTLTTLRTIAADTASRSSLAYTQILFQHFLAAERSGAPGFLPASADPLTMLAHADAALLIGDPALLALEQRPSIDRTLGPCLWLDIAAEWHRLTDLPWVAAVWAVRPSAIPTHASRTQLIEDLNHSRLAGLARIEDLVTEWTPRIALPPATIRHYLTRNIHYTLDPACVRAIELFRNLAHTLQILPPLPTLPFLEP